jgi:hypothetical protein
MPKLCRWILETQPPTHPSVAARKRQIAMGALRFLSETFFAIVPEPVVFLPSLPFFLRLDSRNPIQ